MSYVSDKTALARQHLYEVQSKVDTIERHTTRLNQVNYITRVNIIQDALEIVLSNLNSIEHEAE